MIIDFSLILKSIPYVLSGLPYTLGISLLSFMVGNVFAIILAFMRMSQKPWLKYPARIYISIMRGVPMLVVLSASLIVSFTSSRGLTVLFRTASAIAVASDHSLIVIFYPLDSIIS